MICPALETSRRNSCIVEVVSFFVSLMFRQQIYFGNSALKRAIETDLIEIMSVNNQIYNK